MEEVLGLYEKPFCERAPVVCIDEKPVVLHADTRSPMAMQPEELPGGAMNTSVAEPPTCFADRAQGGTALHQGDADSLLGRVC